MLYLISMGLHDEKDMSLKALEAAKKCEKLYAEFYTCAVKTDEKKLSMLIGRPVERVERGFLEEGAAKVVSEAKNKDIGIIVPGDFLSATTHIILIEKAKRAGVGYEIIHGSSIFTAVAETGLQLYKFGRTVTLTRDFPDSCLKWIKSNQANGLHTLILLDIDMDAKDGLEVLAKRLPRETKVISASQLGGKSIVYYGKIVELLKKNLGGKPAVLIVPGKLHFSEEEFLDTALYNSTSSTTVKPSLSSTKTP